MWYPPQQPPQQHQPPCWNGYIHHPSPPKQQQQQQQQQPPPSYARTSYFYCNTDESLTTSRATTTYGVARNDENESLIHYHSARIDDVYGAGAEYYVTNSTDSPSYEMSSSALPYQTSITHWNPVISAPIKTSIAANHLHPNEPQTIQPSSSSASASACWDWLLYPPEIYSHLYAPSSSFTHQQQQSQDENLDLLASLPAWLLALLYPAMKPSRAADDENESDREISSLHSKSNQQRPSPDEPALSMNIDRKTTHGSSHFSLAAETTANGPKSEQNRSSTPDTDDGYQSASDASRSDYSQQSAVPYEQASKDDLTGNMPPSLMPKRISYAAAAKPLTAAMLINKKISPSPTPFLKTKNHSSFMSSTEILSNNSNNNNTNMNGQKSKFIAPRFERMHHAKQYSTSTMMKDSSPSSSSSLSSSSSSSTSSSASRTQIRSNHHYNQRQHIVHSSRRR